MRAEFHARRDLVVAGLNALPGVSCRVPHGAFYAFPNVEAVPLAADALAQRAARRGGRRAAHRDRVRRGGGEPPAVSYATSRERLAEGLERMGAFLGALGANGPGT